MAVTVVHDQCHHRLFRKWTDLEVVRLHFGQGYGDFEFHFCTLFDLFGGAFERDTLFFPFFDLDGNLFVEIDEMIAAAKGRKFEVTDLVLEKAQLVPQMIDEDLERSGVVFACAVLEV